MTSNQLADLIQQAEALPLDDRLTLITRLVESVRRDQPNTKPRTRWSDVAGIAPYPLAGEDAQAWVSRTR